MSSTIDSAAKPASTGRARICRVRKKSASYSSVMEVLNAAVLDNEMMFAKEVNIVIRAESISVAQNSLQPAFRRSLSSEQRGC